MVEKCLVPESEVRKCADCWDATATADLEKRLKDNNDKVDFLQIYRLFMPGRYLEILDKSGYLGICDEFERLHSGPESFEDGSTEKYLQWSDKCVKTAIRNLHA